MACEECGVTLWPRVARRCGQACRREAHTATRRNLRWINFGKRWFHTRCVMRRVTIAVNRQFFSEFAKVHFGTYVCLIGRVKCVELLAKNRNFQSYFAAKIQVTFAFACTFWVLKLPNGCCVTSHEAYHTELGRDGRSHRTTLPP